MEPHKPHKRARLDSETTAQAAEVRMRRAAFLSSLSRSVSPPASALPAEPPKPPTLQVPSSSSTDLHEPSKQSRENRATITDKKSRSPRYLSSPFSLTRIRGLPQSKNVDTVSLHDILGDPLIKEAWVFNFCFDVSFLMRHFDADVRDAITVKLVHGSWRREDANKAGIDEACAKLKNVEAITAYLPDAFGTHHSKMFVLFKHDDQAQVVIHTANILERDWSTMTQAVWKSPLLPRLASTNSEVTADVGMLGSGPRFKHDLLRYIGAYGKKLKSLATQLAQYDFSQVCGALIASVPSKFAPTDHADKLWGHVALQKALEVARSEQKEKETESTSHLVCQVSSIATLPATWLDSTILLAARAFHAPPLSITSSIIFPTRADVASSISGYADGGSIHVKAQSAAHQKQIAALRPQLSRWTAGLDSAFQAGRHDVAPHIKTFINFERRPTKQNPTPHINWALVTSANLSQQAWGTAPKLPKGSKDPSDAVVHIQSFEIGVLVWPQLFEEDNSEKQEGQHVRMVPTFGSDMPTAGAATNGETVVGLRMPYDLPLTPYAADEMPWSPHSRYTEPDRHGRRWPESFF